MLEVERKGGISMKLEMSKYQQLLKTQRFENQIPLTLSSEVCSLNPAEFFATH